MNKKLLQELKENLEKKKKELEKILQSFAQKDKKLPHDWDTRFPVWNGETGSAALERAADQVEEYSTLLSIEHNLEIKLKNVNLALKKIEKGKYGICEKCQKSIDVERLKIFPEAKFCQKCKE